MFTPSLYLNFTFGILCLLRASPALLHSSYYYFDSLYGILQDGESNLIIYVSSISLIVSSFIIIYEFPAPSANCL